MRHGTCSFGTDAGKFSRQEGRLVVETATIVTYEFFARKAKILILTLLTYAALC